MMGKEVVLWLDERWYNAINKHLKDETLEEHLEEVIDQLCNKLPEHEYARISHEIWQEEQQAQKDAEAGRRFAVFHVREQERDWTFRMDENMDALHAARKLRSYMQGQPDNPESKFIDAFKKAVPITHREFNEAMIERLEKSERVTGVFDIDMDAGKFSALHAASGWQAFTCRSVSTAAYFAMKKDHEPWEARLSAFTARLEGRQINNEHEYTILRGERSLDSSDIKFADEIIQTDNYLEFYMEVNFNTDELFGTNIRTDHPGRFLNVYANYDMETQQVCDVLNVILVGDAGDIELHYPLSQEEKELMIPEMDAFSQKRYGQSLADCRAQYLEEVGAECQQEPQSVPEMQM